MLRCNLKTVLPVHNLDIAELYQLGSVLQYTDLPVNRDSPSHFVISQRKGEKEIVEEIKVATPGQFFKPCFSINKYFEQTELPESFSKLFYFLK